MPIQSRSAQNLSGHEELYSIIMSLANIIDLKTSINICLCSRINICKQKETNGLLLSMEVCKIYQEK